MLKTPNTSAVKVGSAFLAGMLVAVLFSLFCGLNGLPSLTWADESSSTVKIGRAHV